MQKWTRYKEVKTNCPKGVQKEVPRWAYGSRSDNSSKSGVPRWLITQRFRRIISLFFPPHDTSLHLHHPAMLCVFTITIHCLLSLTIPVKEEPVVYYSTPIQSSFDPEAGVRLLPLSICLFVKRALHWNLSRAPFLHLYWPSDFCVGETYARAPCLAYGFLSSRLLFFHPSICSCCSLSFVCHMMTLFRACVSHFTAYMHKWLPAAQVSCSRLYRFLPFIDKQAPASVNVDSSSAQREHRYTPGNVWKHDLA